MSESVGGSPEPWYCGCCGRPTLFGNVDEWCMDCLRDHIDTLARRPEDATYFAQYLKACPFSVLGVQETEGT